MSGPYFLQQTWKRSGTPRQERLWTVAWLIWGTIGAVGVGLGDHSLPAGVLWLLAGALIAVFGLAIWGLFTNAVFELTPKRSPSSPSQDDLRDLDSDRASFLYLLGNEQLSILDPNRKWWELYPSVVLGVAPIHGIWAGSLIGMAAYYIGVWPRSALKGALIGAVGGILVVMLIYGVETAVIIARTRGPRIDGLRPIVRQACVVAGSCGHEFLLPGHLLTALVENPRGEIAKVLGDTERETAEARRYIRDVTDKQAQPDGSTLGIDDDESGRETELLDAWTVLSTAIDEARRLHHVEAGPGHVLLALLTCNAELTTHALTILGVPIDGLRQRILDCM